MRPDKVLVVGCGGIGGWLIPPLIKLLHGHEIPDPEGHPEVVFMDGDAVEEGNLLRQNFTEDHLGENKAKTFVPDRPGFRFEDMYLGEENVEALVPEGTLVIAGPDNHVCRRILAERCEKLNNCVLILAGNEEHDGNVSVHGRGGGADFTATYRERHPEVWKAVDDDRSTMSCEQLAALPGGGQTMAANFMAAAIILCQVERVLSGAQPFSDVYFETWDIKAGGTA